MSLLFPPETFQQLQEMIGPHGFECADCKRILPGRDLTGLQSYYALSNGATTALRLRCKDCVAGVPVVPRKLSWGDRWRHLLGE